MKLRVASIGWDIEHEDISEIDFYQGESISSYDAVLLNPNHLPVEWTAIYSSMDKTGPSVSKNEKLFVTPTQTEAAHAILDGEKRKEKEILELLYKVGGVLVAKITSPVTLSMRDRQGQGQEREKITNYSWLPKVRGEGPIWDLSETIPRAIEERCGIRIDGVQVKSPAHPFSNYVNVLKRDNKEVAGFDVGALLNPPEGLADRYITEIATSRIDHLLAAEISVGHGRIVFLPEVEVYNTERETGLLLECISAIIGEETPSNTPEWVEQFHIPGEEQHQEEIEEINEKLDRLKGRKKKLQGDQQEIVSYKKLLYGSGKFVLEPQVRQALELFGFQVTRKPTEYEIDEEYDAVLHSSEFEMGAIAEVEGRDNKPINLGKYRQLLDKVDRARSETDNKYTGILIGNAYRLSPPEERDNQFTERALHRCEDQNYAAVTTTELYKAVQKVLENPKDKTFKEKIRSKLIASSGFTTLF